MGTKDTSIKDKFEDLYQAIQQLEDNETIEELFQSISEDVTLRDKLIAQKLYEEQVQNEQKDKLLKKSRFNEFGQLNLDDMSTKRLNQMVKDNPMAFRLFLQLVKYMDGFNACMASYNVLSKILGVSKPTISRAIKYLKDNDYLRVYKSGTANVYAIDDSIIWKSWGSNRKYSAFKSDEYIAEVSTNVIMSSDEQDQIIEQKIKNRKIPQVQILEYIDDLNNKK